MAMKRLSLLLAPSSAASPASPAFLGFPFERSQIRNMGMILKPSLLFKDNNPFCCLHSCSSGGSYRHSKDKKGCSFSNINDALSAFNHMLHLQPQPSIVQFSKLLSAVVRMRYYETVLFLSKQMELAGISHNVYTFNILINCFCHLHADSGFSVLAKIIKLGFEPSVVTFSTLVNGLCIEGRIARAVEFFNDMVARGYEPNLHTYNTIINGLCKIGDTSVAAGLLKKMDEAGCEPDVVTYNTIIDNLCKDRLVNEALDIFSQMKGKSIKPDVITYTSLMHGLCNSGQWKEASALLNEMMGLNIMPDVVTFSMLIDTLCKEGEVSEAQGVLKQMTEKGVEPNIFTYNSLMDGYCLRREVVEARKILDVMISRGCSPCLS
jgi:pentatricopeptide repeat protein